MRVKYYPSNNFPPFLYQVKSLNPLEFERYTLHHKLNRYLYSPNPPQYNLHLNHSPGFGKSHITIEELEETDSLYEYLVPKHALGTEMINRMVGLFGYIQIESRQRVCEHEAYIKLAAAGINIKPFCQTCELMHRCQYYQRLIEIFDNPQPWVGVHHHLGGLANYYAEDKQIDAIVIDENFLSAIYKHYQFGYPLIIATYNLLSRMDNCDEKTLLHEFLQEFLFSFQNQGNLNTEYLYSIIYHYFHAAGNNASSLLAFAEEYEMWLADFYFKKSKLFRNIVTPICETICDIWQHYVPISQENYLDYINHIFEVHIGKRVVVDMARYDLAALDIPCKVLILDATTPTSFYQRLFGRRIKPIRKDLQINSVVYQVKSAKYVMRTLDTNQNTFNRLCNIVRLIADKHPEGVLVLSRKKYEEDIKKVNPAVIQTDHYPLRGSNDYQNLDVVVVFGTPEPRRDVLQRTSVLLNCDKKQLHYIMRETNIIQGVHRIRPTLKRDTPTYIYLLTKLPLPFENVKNLTIGKLERLLKGEVQGYCTEETEDRIREDILTLLESGPTSLTPLVDQIIGNTTVIREVIRRLREEKMIRIYKEEKEGPGRRKSMCSLN